jgi:U3 small nucleolar RNA-associated protein 14
MEPYCLILCVIIVYSLFQIQRKVGFRNVKTQLARWDAVVYSNRAADQLSFPLKQSTVNVQTTDDFISKLKVCVKSVVVY